MKKRQSNIELLRIISMLFILIVHFDGAALGLPTITNISMFADFGVFSKIFIESISIIGVNCFVLISGYFGIRASVKGLLTFTLWCLFYSVGLYLCKCVVLPHFFTAGNLFESFLVFSRTDLWFIPAYLGLYIFAPIINRGIENISNKEFSWTLIGVIFINVYLGWWWEGKVNPTGYNVMQLIMIYMIGRYIALLFFRHEFVKQFNSTLGFGMLYIFATLLIIVSTVMLSTGKAFAYNSPFIIFASVAFFLIFTTFTFSNRWINYVASSAFAVYLIHKTPVVWGVLKKLVAQWACDYDYLQFTLLVTVLIVVVFVGCIAIDKVRERIMNPIIGYLLSAFSKKE